MVGAQHCINIWSTRYNRSLIQLLLKLPDIKIRLPIFFIYSVDDDIVMKFRSSLTYHPSMQFAFQEVKLGKNQEAINQFPELIIEKFKNSAFISTEKSSININQYWLVKPRDETLVGDIIRYLEDLGSCEIQSKQLIKVTIDSKILKKEVRSILGLDRVAIKPLSEQGRQYLFNKIPGIAIEEDPSKQNETKWLLTFVDDKNNKTVEGIKKNRDHISSAVDLYSIQASTDKSRLMTKAL